MAQNNLISPAVEGAFAAFISDVSLLALPMSFESGILQALPSVQTEEKSASFQNNLNLLDDVLQPQTTLYLLVRRNNQIFAITFVPHRAPEDQKELYLRHRNVLVENLGEEHFKKNLICKEIGEITDARSWTERDEDHSANGTEEDTSVCNESHDAKDAGYKKNKCRLCDRRMKNKITDEALTALKTLNNEGTCVQILLYFIFHSPDSATVQQRMKHTMAIPGLVNVHAEDCGVHVDQKIEIHEPDELVFEESDERVGRFRSVYLRGEWKGMESRYEGLERDGAFWDAVR
ncbi:Twinfilin-1 [Neodidymelliopsis sp. IMI 364377]|nr:Twinfilin-1 [Neodidymelliopsis sp. IMI 364377]